MTVDYPDCAVNVDCDVFAEESLRRGLALWLADFHNYPLLAKNMCVEWRESAKSVLAAKYENCDTNLERRFRRITDLLAALCVHGTARIEPMPLLEAAEVMTAWAFWRGTRPSGRTMEEPEVFEKYDRAECVLRQIEIAANVAQEKGNRK